MSEVNEVINQAKQALKALNDKLIKLDEIFDEITKLKQGPAEFNAKISEAFDLTKEFTNSLNEVSKKYIDGNNKIFEENLSEFKSSVNDLNIQVSKLIEVDFDLLFRKMQKRFFEENTKKIDAEILKFKIILHSFQEISAKLNDAAIRLAAIDLTKQFNEVKNHLKDINVSIGNLKSGLDSAINGIQKGIKEILEEVIIVGNRIQNLDESIDATKHQIVKQLQLERERILSHQLTLHQDVKYEIQSLAKENQEMIIQLRAENQLLKAKVDRNLYVLLTLSALAVISAAGLALKYFKYI